MQKTPYPNRLRALVKAAGLTMREVHRETGIPESTLRWYASGNGVIPNRDRIVLARIIGCEVTDLAPQTDTSTMVSPEPVEELTLVTDLAPQTNTSTQPPTIIPSPPTRRQLLMMLAKVGTGVGVVGAGGLIAWLLYSRPSPIPTPAPTSTPYTGPFYVYDHYDPSGYVGDTGDIKSVAKEPSGLVRFTYIAKGRGPHEWEYKYIDGVLNTTPCQFAGVLYLDPPNNFGTDPHGGYDLRGRHIIKWQARSLNGPAYVEFVAGGVVWMWDETHTRVPVPYPESMPRTSLGIQELTETWQTFQFDLSARSQDELRDVVAGFGWVITWASNGVQLSDAGTEAQQPKTFIIEIQGIAYER